MVKIETIMKVMVKKLTFLVGNFFPADVHQVTNWQKPV